MFDGIKDEFYDKIQKKIEDGIFKKGKNCKLQQYSISKNIQEIPIDKRTPEVCLSLMAYSRCQLSDVPNSSRTRDFFINAFTNNGVNNYIRSHISNFDQQFFKDLIETNNYATHFSDNCFEIMPLEYIDEEMCSLAIVGTTDWASGDWFFTVYKRKPEALTADLWNLGARFYSRLSGKENYFLSITPEEYRTEEYYKEMCGCNFNCGMSLADNKGKIMESIPEEVLTRKFLLDLLQRDINSVARFSESALETEIPYIGVEEIISEKIWQFIVRLKGDTIRYIKLNDERVEFFLRHYDKDSGEYRYCFKDRYKRYKKEKEDAEAFAQTQERTHDDIKVMGRLLLENTVQQVWRGVDVSEALENAIDASGIVILSSIPIKYKGIVPQEFCKKYDTEEYLRMLYETMGIQIIEEYDNLFYRVKFPEGWATDHDGYWNYVKDSAGNIVIEYFSDSKFYDREAYVKVVNIPKQKTDETGRQI